MRPAPQLSNLRHGVAVFFLYADVRVRSITIRCLSFACECRLIQEWRHLGSSGGRWDVGEISLPSQNSDRVVIQNPQVHRGFWR